MGTEVAFSNAVFGLVLAGQKLLVPVARTVRTGIDALAAADAQIVVKKDHAIGAFVGCAITVSDFFAVRRRELFTALGILRADFNTRRDLVLLVALAMVAQPGHIEFLGPGVLADDFIVDGCSKCA
jgi:hypothetical protein